MELDNLFYQEILKELNCSNVDYILIGGLAVGYHGYSRYTGDMDLWVKPTQENLDNLYNALLAMGYSIEQVGKIKREREIENPSPIKLWDDSHTLKVDLMTNTFQKEITWDECKKESISIKVEKNSLSVVNINHLITMKKNTKRLDNSLKDLVDADELFKIKILKEKRDNNYRL